MAGKPCPIVPRRHVLGVTNQIALFALATLFGGMIFFAAIMAPLVFTRLPGAEAGRFIRAVFPVYYLYVLILAVAATLAIPPSIPSAAMALVAILTVGLRQWLMPRINRLSDAAQAGDQAAKTRFDFAHRASVAVNFVQILVCGAVLAQYGLMH